MTGLPVRTAVRLLGQHPERRVHLEQILALDPVEACEQIYRTIALYELPWEMRLGHNLGYYQTMAAPRIAALLARTGWSEQQPEKRAYDTGLFMYELFAHGFDSPTGRHVVRRLNQMHRGYGIRNEDFLYVLAVFAVTPTRFISRYGWRSLTDHETTATWAFYRRLAQLMNLQDVPDSYAALEALFDQYGQTELHPTADSHRLMAAAQAVVADRLPRPLRPFGDTVASLLLDRRTRYALGVADPPLGAARVLQLSTSARGVVVRRMPPRRTSWFTSGQATGPYPHGYELDELGPSQRNASSTKSQ